MPGCPVTTATGAFVQISGFCFSFIISYDFVVDPDVFSLAGS
jgi:hypothetical protein